MIEIYHEPAPTPTPNPFAFDPETGAGEFVQCIAEYAGLSALTFRKPYEVRSVTPDGPYVRNDDGQHHVYERRCFQNIHEAKPGMWVLGRDPALIRKAEPRVFTLDEMETLAKAGDVFHTADVEKGETEWFIQTGNGWVGVSTSGHCCTLEELDGLRSDRRLHYYGNHNLTVTLPAEPVPFR